MEVLLVSTLFLIPVGLLFLDGITLVAAVAANNSLCKAGARAAGNQPNSGSARRALDQVIARFPKSQIISNVTLSEFAYYDPASYVDVKTTMTVVLPAQLPGLPEQLTVTASSRQSNTAVRARFRA